MPALPDLAEIDSESRQTLSAAQTELKAHLDQLRHWSGQATSAQVAAVTAVEGVIVVAARRQAEWARLRLTAMW
jgi:hypothetical protein